MIIEMYEIDETTEYSYWIQVALKFVTTNSRSNGLIYHWFVMRSSPLFVHTMSNWFLFIYLLFSLFRGSTVKRRYYQFSIKIDQLQLCTVCVKLYRNEWALFEGLFHNPEPLIAWKSVIGCGIHVINEMHVLCLSIDGTYQLMDVEPFNSLEAQSFLVLAWKLPKKIWW